MSVVGGVLPSGCGQILGFVSACLPTPLPCVGSLPGAEETSLVKSAGDENFM